MIGYLTRRIFLFIPTLIIISVATFFLSKTAPTDVVSSQFKGNFSEADFVKEARAQGLDSPNFYFTLTTQAFPDTFHRVLFSDRKETLEYLIGTYGNWEGVNGYYQAIYNFKNKTEERLPEGAAQNRLLVLTGELFLQKKESKISNKLKSLTAFLQKDSLTQSALLNDFKNLNLRYLEMLRSKNLDNHWIPNFIWHGSDNQYHQWISNFLRGNFGLSATGESVSKRIKDAVFWTFILNIIAMTLSFEIAIPLAIKAAANENSRFDQNTNFILYGLFSLPTFWVGTMFLIFFCTSEYGMNWFPSGGLGAITGTHRSFFALIGDRFYHLILPIFCLTYPSLAYIFRQMRGSMIAELKKNYIRTARAKGLPKSKILRNHALPNALFPIITLAANLLPSLIAGSVAIEVVFSLPGMGRLMIESISDNDWNIVYAVMMFGAILTMIGVLISDILYAWLDPRVRF